MWAAGRGQRAGGVALQYLMRNNLSEGKAFSKSPCARPLPMPSGEPGTKTSHMQEFAARIKINKLPENAVRRFNFLRKTYFR